MINTQLDDFDGVVALVERGANVNACCTSGWTSVRYALYSRHSALFKYLIEHGVHVNATTVDGKSLLAEAIIGNNASAVECLLTNGADVNHRADDGLTPLMLAASNRSHNIKIIIDLVEHGANLDETTHEPQTALCYAADNGFFECVAYLLEQGADVNGPLAIGVHALFNASFGRHKDCFLYLLEHVVTIGDLDDDVRASLKHAAMSDDWRRVAAILTHA